MTTVPSNLTRLVPFGHNAGVMFPEANLPIWARLLKQAPLSKAGWYFGPLLDASGQNELRGSDSETRGSAVRGFVPESDTLSARADTYVTPHKVCQDAPFCVAAKHTWQFGFLGSETFFTNSANSVGSGAECQQDVSRRRAGWTSR